MKNQFINSGINLRAVKCLILLMFSCQVWSQNVITSVDLKTGVNGMVIVDFEFDSVPKTPETFSTNLPPRLALDFEDTINSTGVTNMNIGTGSAKGLRIVSANSKTRVVLDFTKEFTHKFEVNGNVLSLILLNGDKGKVSKSDSATEVEFVDFRRGQEGQAIISVSLSNNNAPINLSEINGKVVVEISNSQVSESMDRKLDVIDFATPVSYVDTRQSGQTVKIEIEAQGAYNKLAYQTGNLYTVEITEKKDSELIKSKLIDDEIVYVGNLVSFTFMDIPIRSVIQLIADASQLNIIVADTVSGNVTMRLTNVPWDHALDVVLQSKQLDQRRTGDVIWVAPASEIMQREQEKLEALSKKIELQALDNVFIQVNYARAEDLATLISGTESSGDSGSSNSLLSDRGSVTFDERTNTLLVNDIPDRISVIQELVNTLDRSVEQVQIESRIVVASEKFGDELGVRFGINGSHEDKYGNIISTGGSALAVDRLTNNALINRYTSPSGSGLPTVSPGTEGGLITGPPIGERLNVNLPAIASSAGTWAASILAADFLLDLELSALETEDRGEVISSPRVITANQSEATIQQGVQIPYQEASSSGATATQFKDAALTLKVTPLITPDERIDLTLQVNQDSVGELVSQGEGSVPSIDTRSVQTRVLVNNGQTIVLGGIYEQVRRTTRSKVPVLGDIPGLGNLFRNKSISDNKAELLIFVTPTIIKESL